MTVRVRVTDDWGLTGTDRTAVTVYFNWDGFFQPVTNQPMVNDVKAGSAVPLKFSLGGNQDFGDFQDRLPGVGASCLRR